VVPVTGPATPLRVLLVEDREDDAAIVILALEQGGYDVTWQRVETPEATTEALRAQTWDVIISDFHLPRFSAPAALALRRELAIDTPFIIVSGTIAEEDAVETMKAGAIDFVTKGKFARLAPAVARGLREVEERQARKKAEAQLQQAQKMEAVGLLAGGVAHDFNNILGIITGYCGLLLRDLDAHDRQRPRVQQVLSAAERGAALTRQLLAFGRKQVLQPRVFDLNAVVVDTERMLRRLIEESVQVSTVTASRLGRVKADPGQIGQVIMNLAVNARDAMPQGGRLIIETADVDLDEIYARSHPGVERGRYVVLAVSDTGHGMDAGTLARVFEPFFTTKEAGKGTGLGLATVYGIVKQSGGHISVYSELGRGSTFKVYLPLSEEDVAASAVAPAATAAGGSETILLLEDEPALREVVQEMLETAGYTVLTGPTPKEALQSALDSRGAVDLVLTDVVMPNLSGKEAAARVRDVHPGAPVLFMSGYTDEAIGHHGVLEPTAHFLQKPFTTEVLLNKVRQVLQTLPNSASTS
jgi:two-component system cell cycle sensor histidine kinase/response regulator CckA